MSEVRKIAILHASDIFVSVEPILNDLLAELIPDAEVLHLIDSNLLPDITRDGGLSEATAMRMIELGARADAAEVDVIFSASSSVSPALDWVARGVRAPVVQIDEAMAMTAGRTATCVGVVASVPTTVAPLTALINHHAQGAGRRVMVSSRVSEPAHAALAAGDRRRHDSLIFEAALELSEEVDTLVLAQASMAPLVPRLRMATGSPVLSSPRSGVEYLAQRLAEIAPRT